MRNLIHCFCQDYPPTRGFVSGSLDQRTLTGPSLAAPGLCQEPKSAKAESAEPEKRDLGKEFCYRIQNYRFLDTGFFRVFALGFRIFAALTGKTRR